MDPVSAIGLASSVVGIASFGLQLATTLQTYTSAAREADARIRDIAGDIANAASALRLLHDVIAAHEKSPVFSADGLKAIQAIVTRCDAAFKRTVELLNRAGRPGTRLSDADRAPDLRISTLDHIRWPWLEPKIARCREELERVFLKLLVMLQIANLARQQKTNAERKPHEFAEEAELRRAVARLRARERRLEERLARERRRAEEHAQKGVEGLREPPPSPPPSPGPGPGPGPGPDASHDRDPSPDREPGIVSDLAKDPAMPPPSPPSGDELSPSLSPQDSSSLFQEEFNAPPNLPGTSIPLDPPNPPQILPDDPKPKTIEAYLLPRGHDTALQIPLPQAELHAQLTRVLARTSSSPFDALLSLSARDQASVAAALRHARDLDARERRLVAIDRRTPPRPWRPWSWRRRVLLFLEIVPRPTWTRMHRRHLSLETLARFNIPYEVDLDPDFVLVKRWVPTHEQDALWADTAALRARREAARVETEARMLPRRTVEFEVGRATRRRDGEDEETSVVEEMAPVVKEIAVMKEAPVVEDDDDDDEVPQDDVDDMLARWTTVFGKTKGAPEDAPDDLAEDFLRGTALDDDSSGAEGASVGDARE